MPDTNVYIASAAGTLPLEAEELLRRALLFHCSVSLAELSTGVANANPADVRWQGMRDHYANIMGAIPDTRVLVPNQDVWLDAGVLAGTAARTQGFALGRRKDILNDALIYLTATRAGLPVLTSNRRDFDILQQLAPEGRFYLY